MSRIENLPEHVFREYDIRGTVGSEITENFAFLLGRAYGSLIEPTNTLPVAISHDCRHSSPSLSKALADGIRTAGQNVVFHGVGPTPQLYYSVFSSERAGGIQVTGSHNPPDMNGFKILLGKEGQSGEQIQNLKRIMIELNEKTDGLEATGGLVEEDITESFQNYIIENSKPHFGERKVKVVVDAGNGVAGISGPKVLRELGCEVIELYCEPDGDFPNHHPDPTVIENIVDLAAAVKEQGADVGIGWDGDGDRIGIVDERGEVVFGDMLLLLYGRAVAEELDSPKVIGDVKCSSHLFEQLKSAGAEPLMWKTGHSLIKKKIAEEGAALGGEMSGHMFFKHRFFGYDDAIYSSARLAEIISKSDQTISQMLADVPKTVATPEIRRDCPEHIKFEAPKRLAELFTDYPNSTLDGIRIEFPEGWGLVRASNTQPVLVLRFEANSQEKLQEYQGIVEEKLGTVLADLS